MSEAEAPPIGIDLPGKGLKDTAEILRALGILGVFGINVFKNGKVGPEDISHVIALGSNIKEVVAGFKDLDLALSELKDLEHGELVAVVGIIYSEVDRIKKALKAE